MTHGETRKSVRSIPRARLGAIDGECRGSSVLCIRVESHSGPLLEDAYKSNAFRIGLFLPPALLGKPGPEPFLLVVQSAAHFEVTFHNFLRRIACDHDLVHRAELSVRSDDAPEYAQLSVLY